MQVKGKENRRLAVKLSFTGSLLVAATLVGNFAMAQVTGTCSNCHTMHNSQGGNNQVFIGSGVGWSAGSLNGTSSSDGQNQLLKTDCVGCHTNTATADTILTIGSSRVPIVYNTTGYPGNPLAGGNFFRVATQDGYGHNVRGISSQDGTLAFAPGDAGALGGQVGMGGCTNSCHVSLTLPDATFNPLTDMAYRFNGCKGCHTQVAHHNASDPSYRYLGGAGGSAHIPYVDGGGASQPNPYEDKDWEQNPTATAHNYYASQPVGSTFIDNSVGAFCAGCHLDFHSMGSFDGPDPITFTPRTNGGDSNADDLVNANSGTNPWLRHPTGVFIPLGDATGEYAQMAGLAYNPAIPVAQGENPGPGPVNNPNVIDRGDQVFCLSCHRAHGSDQPDGLRFNYSLVSAHSDPSGNSTNGCFFCHRNKDNQ